MGFEPTTTSLEGWDSTTELRPPPRLQRTSTSKPETLETFILCTFKRQRHEQARLGGQARIRTLEDISQQIYSLPPLATWVPARNTPSPRRLF